MSKAGSGSGYGRGVGSTGGSRGDMQSPRAGFGTDGMSQAEIDKLIDETDIMPLASDFTPGRPSTKKVTFKTEDPPIEIPPSISPAGPKPILGDFDNDQRKAVMLFNSRRFKRVLAMNTIPGRFSKENTPIPEYLINKIRGGPLEYVKCFTDTQSVTFAFIHPADAQALWDFFNKEPDAKECHRRFNLQVSWDHEAIESLSRSIIEAIIDHSATRVIKVFQCPSEKTNAELKEDFCMTGPGDGFSEVISVKAKREKTRRKNNGGLGLVAYVQCSSIQYASKLLGAIKKNEYTGFQDAEVYYADDPCAFKDGNPLQLGSLRSW
jgi:hypothetical protein